MPKCQHCKNVELKLKPDERTPEGLYECPECHCLFRITLAQYDNKCYAKMYPEEKKREKKDPTEVLNKSIEENTEVLEGLNTGKKKRGRPKKSDVGMIL